MWFFYVSHVRRSRKGLKMFFFTAMHPAPHPISGPSPAHVLLLTSSADGPMSVIWPCPSTMRSSSCDVPERDIPTTGQDSDWNYKKKKERDEVYQRYECSEWRYQHFFFLLTVMRNTYPSSGSKWLIQKRGKLHRLSIDKIHLYESIRIWHKCVYSASPFSMDDIKCQPFLLKSKSSYIASIDFHFTQKNKPVSSVFHTLINSNTCKCKFKHTNCTTSELQTHVWMPKKSWKQHLALLTRL